MGKDMGNAKFAAPSILILALTRAVLYRRPNVAWFDLGNRIAPAKWVKVENIFTRLVMKNRLKLLFSREAEISPQWDQAHMRGPALRD
jgi:hypothetical protein